MTMEFSSDPTCQGLLARLKEKGIIVTMLGGNCPVQGEGSIEHESGKRVAFYFRARGNSWSIEIGRKGREMAGDAWAHREPWPGGKYDAGYMEQHQALPLIERGVLFWRKDGAPLNPGFPQDHLLAHLGRAYETIRIFGFEQWFNNAGGNERDQFYALHQYGTEREDAIGNRIYEQMQSIKRTGRNGPDVKPSGQDAVFTKWLTERSEATITNILEMQG